MWNNVHPDSPLGKWNRFKIFIAVYVIGLFIGSLGISFTSIPAALVVFGLGIIILAIIILNSKRVW